MEIKFIKIELTKSAPNEEAILTGPKADLILHAGPDQYDLLPIMRSREPPRARAPTPHNCMT